MVAYTRRAEITKSQIHNEARGVRDGPNMGAVLGRGAGRTLARALVNALANKIVDTLVEAIGLKSLSYNDVSNVGIRLWINIQLSFISSRQIMENYLRRKMSLI